MVKEAKTQYPVHQLIKNRWSPRAFSGEPIPQETLLTLFEAASWAASARNEQPWKFIVGIKEQGENYDKLFKTLVPGNQIWAISAPVLGIGIVKTHFEKNNTFNTYANYDLGQALAIMSIQATANNLYVHQMGGFEKNLATELFNIPQEYLPIIAFAIGYLGEASQLPPDLFEQEKKPRTRKKLDDILFLGDFNINKEA